MMTLYLTCVVLFSAVVLSGMVMFVMPFKKDRVRLLLSFSGAYLFALSLVHFLPEIYHSAGAKAGLWVLLGFLIQLVLEIISGGIEHGHIHVHKKHGAKAVVPYAVILGLGIHSFLEGMPLAFSVEGGGAFSNTPLLMGILLHKIPVAFVLVTLLLQSGVSRQKTFMWLIIFAMIAPLGAVVGNLFDAGMGHDHEHGGQFTAAVMGVVVGIFLHVSTTILFEAGEGHRFNLMKFITVIIGASLALFSM